MRSDLDEVLSIASIYESCIASRVLLHEVIFNCQAALKGLEAFREKMDDEEGKPGGSKSCVIITVGDVSAGESQSLRSTAYQERGGSPSKKMVSLFCTQ
jgi:hypothetical protein